MIKRGIFISIVILTMVLSSCNSDEQAPTTSNVSETTTTTPTSNAIVTTTTVTTTTSNSSTNTEEPQYGMGFTYLHNVSERSPVGWDPQDRNFLITFYTGFYLESLIVGDLDKNPRGTWSYQSRIMITDEQQTGELAENWEVVDDKTLVIHVRRNIQFSGKSGVMNSREMTANDVVFCLNRYRTNPKTPVRDVEWIDSITATDKYTVTIKMKYYYPDWAYYLGWGYYQAIYPPELLNAPNGGISNWKNAVGTGPFIVSDYVTDSMVTYTRNDDYWAKTTINGKEYQLPFVQTVRIPIIVDIPTRIAALRTGKADLYDYTAWNDALNLDNAKIKGLIHIKAAPATSTAIFLKTDRTDRPEGDIRVRQALSMAINREEMLKILYKGDGVPLNIPMQTVWESLFTPIEELPDDVKEVLTYNPEKAKELLAEAGYPGGGFTLHIASANIWDDPAALVINYWEKIGVSVKYETSDVTTFVGRWWSNPAADIDGSFYSHTGATPIALFSVYVIKGGGSAKHNLNDPFIEQMYQKIIVEKDINARNALIKEASNQYIKSAAVVTLPIMNNHIFYWQWVKNYYGEVQVGCYKPGPLFARLWIDQKLKAQLTAN